MIPFLVDQNFNSQDSSIKNMAVLDIARGTARVHRIRVHPTFAGQADYLTCFQCGLILRKFSVPAEKRLDLAPSPKGLRDVNKLVIDHSANKRLPAEVMRDFASQTFNGLMVQLVSTPVSMRVDSWITESFPELEDSMWTTLARNTSFGAYRDDSAACTWSAGCTRDIGVPT